MAKFSNSTPARKSSTAKSAIVSTPSPTERTFEGGAGYLRTPEGEAFLLASGGFLGGEKTFYEGGGERDERFRHLIRELSVTNPDWVADFLFWLRREGNIRTASIIGAAEYVWARRDEIGTGRTGTVHPTPKKTTRHVVESVLLRPDEPQEIIGYWLSRYGRKIPMPLKRGVNDAINRSYNERNVLKYDSDKRALRMADVLKLTHAKPADAKQDLLFEYLMARRFNRVDRFDVKGLPVISAYEDLMRVPIPERRKMALDFPQALGDAGITWESLAGWVQGPMDARLWEIAIPHMGYMALLRNLRNFSEAGIDGWALKLVEDKLKNVDEIRNSKQLPFRFWNAYVANANNLTWASTAESAINRSLVNVPALSGRTLILVDQSGSMYGGRMSEHSSVNWSEAAALFGSALALRAENADLIQFGTDHKVVPFRKGDSLLLTAKKFSSMGGTNTARALGDRFNGHDRVIIVTDEQCTPGYVGNAVWGYATNINDIIPQSVPMYMWNFGGYRVGSAPSGMENRHTLGGLSDSAFRMIPLIEDGVDGTWPWEVSHRS